MPLLKITLNLEAPSELSQDQLILALDDGLLVMQNRLQGIHEDFKFCDQVTIKTIKRKKPPKNLPGQQALFADMQDEVDIAANSGENQKN